jgi:hypothetical protein
MNDSKPSGGLFTPKTPKTPKGGLKTEQIKRKKDKLRRLLESNGIEIRSRIKSPPWGI